MRCYAKRESVQITRKKRDHCDEYRLEKVTEIFKLKSCPTTTQKPNTWMWMKFSLKSPKVSETLRVQSYKAEHETVTRIGPVTVNNEYLWQTISHFDVDQIVIRPVAGQKKRPPEYLSQKTILIYFIIALNNSFSKFVGEPIWSSRFAAFFFLFWSVQHQIEMTISTKRPANGKIMKRKEESFFYNGLWFIIQSLSCKQRHLK